MADPIPATKPTTAPVAPPPPAAKADVKVETKVETPPPAAPPPGGETDQRWRFFLDGTFATARLGGPNGGLFAHEFSPTNEGFDFSQKSLGLGFAYKIWNPSPYFQLWAGAQGGYRNLSGNKNAPGEMHGGYLGGHICAASEGLYQSKKDRIILGPELCGRVSAILMTGDSTAGNNFSVAPTGGFGVSINPYLVPIGFQLGAAQIKPFAMVDTSVMPDAREKANAPVLAWGGGLQVGWTFGKTEKVETPKPVVVEKCEPSKELLEKLRSEINGKDGQAGLKAQVADYEKKIVEKRALLKTRAVDPLDDKGVLTVLRDQRAAELSQKDLEGLDPKKDEAKIKEIKAKAAVKAEADFPDVEKFWNPEPRNIDEKNLIIPDPLPTDCDKLTDLVKTVTSARDNLAARLEGLKKVYDAPFPPRVREVISKVVDTVRPNLKDIHFENNRPFPYELANFKKQLETAKSGGKVDWENKALKATMNAVFGASYVPKVIKAIQDTATALNGDLIKEVKNIEVQGHTSKAGGDGLNIPLSDRRANMVMEMLIAEGVDRSRVTAKGYGYSRPRTPEEGIKPGPEAAAAAADNRRIELSIPETEITRIESMGGKLPELSTPKKEPAPPPAPKPSAAPPIAPAPTAPKPPPPAPTGPKPPPVPPPPPPAPDIK